MIRHNAFYVRCTSEHAYLSISKDHWIIIGESPKYSLNSIGVWERKEALALAAAAEWPFGRRIVQAHRAPICACCGKHGLVEKLTEVFGDNIRQWRCERHLGRNPCAIAGCGRTWAGRSPQLNAWLCHRHWPLVPTEMKQVYNRIFRLVRKGGGWTDGLLLRYHRLWPRIVRKAVEKARGDVDIAEIEKLFGL